ncbi:beta-propeller domain-containing protein [Candidatus Parabeggiatoa sp. HSG14]|uniref:beta-propeller domain-containing protein n=1 Tax=Candidatus Parabeggiatoa sp. HSG14 TaxID=3055593 RepID=UPI0025A87A2E|nr:beta-propeller domain-containing protein [Thiotrichales bacterium HSG14]
MKHKLQSLLPILITTTCLSMPVQSEQHEEAQAVTSATLETMGSCPSLLAKMKETAIQKMENRLNTNFHNAIRWGLCGRGYYYSDVADSVASIAPVAAPANSNTASGATEYSETNVQVTGVDEADFVKNDGAYIYILANGKFRIVDSWPAENASEVSAFDIEGIPKKLFVHEERAFIYSSLDRLTQNYAHYPSHFGASECTYGYNCDFTGDGREMKVTILDISEVTAPRLIREMRFSGAYLNARRIGNAVHSVVIFPEPQIAELKFWPDEEWSKPFCYEEGDVPSFEKITEVFETLKEENRQLIQATNINDWLPSAQDVRYNEGATQENNALFESCENFYQSEQKDGMNYLSIVSTDINGESPLNTTTITGKPGAVYASKSALYVAAKHSRNTVYTPWFFPNNVDIEEASTIHKFSLDNDNQASQYVGSGVVKGRVLNQFSMDEFNGFFRIATTTGHLSDPTTHSTISILEEKSNTLVIAGLVDNIAPTEDIRSARFMGDKGYVVTFKKTDPLFVFDLSDPYNPTIAGELKIPGFSTYMHRLDDNHLLTIGYDADDQGRFAWFQGIMLQIFDVSDMANPLLIHKEIIGTRGSTSEAATNHLAFNYFGSKGLLAIPMTICEAGQNSTGQGGRFGDVMTFGGLLVYKVNTETGFELLGGVPHIAPENKEENRRGICYSWWIQSNSYVKRSIFMDDYVFSIADSTIKANRLSAIGEDVSVIHFDNEPQCDAFHANLCATEPECQSTNGQWNADYCALPLYSPRSSKNFSDLCTATYDSVAGVLDIPCINIGGSQHNAVLSLINPSTTSSLQLNLTSTEPAGIRLATQDCEVTYDPANGNVHVPCISQQGTTTEYKADFTLLMEKETPFAMELVGFEENR